MSTTPVILKLADSTPNISLQVFNRDEELELSNSLIPDHRAGTVPILWLWTKRCSTWFDL
ncbi:MAG: hypothetical protein Ct9H300mP11_22870 [Chloroflexota bacterium]|nr:MAG: hypothetical protein Ct9H300mP11_22870 [Chloroflexota bacterium]